MAATLLGIAACTLGMTIALAAACPALADAHAPGRYRARGDSFYSEPEEAPHGLRFADLEAAMGTDPLTWSSDPGWQLHRTPASDLAGASDALRSAIPAGTSLAGAEAVLRKAGTHCAGAADDQLVCSYRDVQTPQEGQYWDNILWRVWLDLADGRVGKVAVTRDWTRR